MKRKGRRNPNKNNEWGKLEPVSERKPVSSVRRKGEEWRKRFGLPSVAWQQYITNHLRKAGLKGRTFKEAQQEMIRGAHRWRLARAYGSPVYPITEDSIANGKLQSFEIMKYVGPDEHDYFPHRAHLRSGARVILLDPTLLRRKDVPVITRGKGYLFRVDKKDLMYSPVKMTKRQMEEARREFELYLESPQAKAIEKKYELR